MTNNTLEDLSGSAYQDCGCCPGWQCDEHRTESERRTRLTDRQRMPVPNDHPCIQDLVIADIEARKQTGIRKYGTPLQPFNGRDALIDAYQEALDLCQYLRQVIEERDQHVFGEHTI